MAALDPLDLLTQAFAAGESFSIPQVGTFVQREGRVELVSGEHRLGDLYLFLGKKFNVAEADMPGIAMNLSVDLKTKLAQGPMRIQQLELKLEGDRITLTDHTPQLTGLQSIRTADGRAIIPPRPKARGELSPSERRAQGEKLAGPKPTGTATPAAGSTSTAPHQTRTSGTGATAPTTTGAPASDETTETEEMPPVLQDIGHGVAEKPVNQVNWMLVSLVTLTAEMLIILTLILVFRKEIKYRLNNRDEAVLARTQTVPGNPAQAVAAEAKPANASTSVPGLRDEADEPADPKPTGPKPAETKPTETPKPNEAKPVPAPVANPPAATKPATPKPAAAKPAETRPVAKPAARPTGSAGPWRLVIASFPTEAEGRVRLAEWTGRPGWDPQLEKWPDGRWRLSIWQGKTSQAVKAKLTDALAAGAPSDAYPKKWN